LKGEDRCSGEPKTPIDLSSLYHIGFSFVCKILRYPYLKDIARRLTTIRGQRRMEWARKERVGLGDTIVERMTEKLRSQNGNDLLE
jgi:hypothetical protein